MRKLPVAAIAVVVGALGANMLFTGCGSDTADLFADSGDETGSADGTTLPGNDTGTPGNDGGAPRDGSFVDAITEGGRADAATCKLVGQDCTASTDCCTANCDATSKKCAAPVTQCKAPGATCATGNECCTFSCTGGTCANKQCVSDNGACGADADCCGGRCAPDGMGGGTCTPLNTTCKTSGNACGPTDRCCSGTCNGGVCASTSFCVQNGDVCSSNFECCGGSCNKVGGAALGTCGVVTAPGGTQCLPAGTLCGGGATATYDGGPLPPCGGSSTEKCCSRSCAPFGPTGVLVCQAMSGCRSVGELCQQDTDCCGAPGVPNDPAGNGSVRCSKAPGAAIGRCDNGTACRPNGAVCKLPTYQCAAENNCCAGNVNQVPEACQPDSLGIPRCTNAGNCVGVDPATKAGMACATSADCCGGPCVPNPDPAGPRLICSAACVKTGNACTTTADCCPGLPCTIPPGASAGICGGVFGTDGGVTTPPDGGTGTDGGMTGDGGMPCALYGQVCGVDGDCCNGVPCTSGRCRQP
jgi:hypothetical protein